MINVKLYFLDDHLYRFTVNGHAEFAEHGSDIVCAGVSALVINTINSIEHFIDENIVMKNMNKSSGVIDCFFPDIKKGKYNEQTTILLQSMVFGLQNLEQVYGDYIKIKI